MGLLAATAAILLPTALAAQRVHVIDVGGTDLVYTPNAIFAQPGDLVSFNFLQMNHTVVESSFDKPCVPLDNGIFAGFHLGGSGSFTVEIKDTKPHWLYCAQKMHCQMGMVAVINPPSDPAKTQCIFAQLAAKAPKNVPGTTIQGGIFTPNDPAPAECSISSSTSSTNSTSSSQSIMAGNPADTVNLALKDNDTADADDQTVQLVVPLDNKPFMSGQLPFNASSLSLVVANGATSLDKIGCSAIVGGKVTVVTSNGEVDVSVNGAAVEVTAVQCGILSGSSSVSSMPAATTFATMTKSATSMATSTPMPTATMSPGKAGQTVRLQFSNDIEESATQMEVPLTGYPISPNEVLTTISVISSPSPNVICAVLSQYNDSLGDVTPAAPLNVEKDGKGTWVAMVTCGMAAASYGA